MSEFEEETYIKRLLFDRFGVRLLKLQESGVKTPDFELLRDGLRVAVLEVKRLERVPRTPENGWRTDGCWLTRPDNGPRRVGALIHDAWKQLCNYAEPKILAFVNDESGVDVHDLEEAFNGSLPYGTEETGYILNEASKPIAEGRIREEKVKIDLYIWLDRHYGERKLVSVYPAGGEPFTETRTERPLFRCTTQSGYDLARRFFKCPDLEPPV